METKGPFVCSKSPLAIRIYSEPNDSTAYVTPFFSRFHVNVFHYPYQVWDVIYFLWLFRLNFILILLTLCLHMSHPSHTLIKDYSNSRLVLHKSVSKYAISNATTQIPSHNSGRPLGRRLESWSRMKYIGLCCLWVMTSDRFLNRTTFEGKEEREPHQGDRDISRMKESV
jgi:hypothetical protein